MPQQVAFGEGLDVSVEQEADVSVLQSKHHRVVVGIRACPTKGPQRRVQDLNTYVLPEQDPGPGLGLQRRNTAPAQKGRPGEKVGFVSRCGAACPTLDDVIDVVPFQEAHQPREMVRVGVGEDYEVNRVLPVRQTLTQFEDQGSRVRASVYQHGETVGALDEYRLPLAYVEDSHP